ncbi:hypothetical protein HEB29_005558 [Streptomyces fulvorobeus]|uniref:Uncharacterized protein n=1 Tax=Streptomyces fulvorobeus TaxID=284028 RepID=A0A7Y9L007_9ACTN|nr:hypothetical protein [Streptomyces fulvorobeus]
MPQPLRAQLSDNKARNASNSTHKGYVPNAPYFQW